MSRVKRGGGVNAAKKRSLTQLRAALDTLHSYELPERYRSSIIRPPAAAATGDENDKENEGVEGGGEATQPVLSDDLVARYRSARESYIRRRIGSVLMEYLPTYDPDCDDSSTSEQSGAFAHPPVPTAQEERALREREETVRAGLVRAAERVDERFRNVRSKYESLVERREELGRMVEELEGKDGGGSDSDMSDDEGSVASATSKGSVDEGEMSAQEKRLEDLIHRRNELRARLRAVRGETALVKASANDARKALEESRRRAAEADGAAEGMEEENGDDDDDVVDSLRRKAEEIRAEAARYREMEGYYESLTEISEQLGGVRILSVEEVARAARNEEHGADEDDDADDTASSMTELVKRSRRRRHSGNSNDEEEVEEELCIKIELLGRHTLRIGLGPGSDLPLAPLSSAGGSGAASGGGSLRAVSARFLTDAFVAGAASSSLYDKDGDETDEDDDSMEDINDPDDRPNRRPPREATVTLPLPSPSDLVLLSRSVPADESVRFLVRECLGRVRATSARASSLARLKVECLTKIYPPSGPEGGLEQTVVCSLGGGRGRWGWGDVTAALRLSSDCPLLPGSVRVDRLVNAGGGDWEEALEGVKERTNGARLRCPLEIVEMLREELDRTAAAATDGETSGGRGVPATPKLPERKRG